MNCTHCGDSGVYREAGSPPEACTCRDDARYNAAARAYLSTATIADMADYGGFADALRRAFKAALPDSAEWDDRRGQLRIPCGKLVPDGKAKLSTLIKLAKLNPEAAA